MAAAAGVIGEGEGAAEIILASGIWFIDKKKVYIFHFSILSFEQIEILIETIREIQMGPGLGPI